MKKLKSLKIHGVKYKVTLGKLTPNILGLCDKANKHLFIEDELNDEELTIKILVHEITHALLHESNIDQVITGEVEELLCLMNERLVEILKVGVK